MKKSNEISAEYGCYVMPDIKFEYNKKKQVICIMLTGIRLGDKNS